MNHKLTFFIYLVAPIVLLLLLFLFFWGIGVSALPFGERSFIGNARTIKPWVIFDQKPSKILISNSRGLYGYNLQGIDWRDAYNFSLTGVTPYEIGRLIQHSYYADAGKVEFFIGIDSVCGATKHALDGSFFDKDYLSEGATFLFGFKRFKALASSPAQVIRNTVMHKGGVDEQGFQSSFPDVNYVKGGVYKSLAAREKADYAKFEFWKNCDSSAFEESLNFLYKNEVNFHLFTNPKHVRTYLAYREKGVFADYFIMLRKYIDLNESIALEYGVEASKISFFNTVTEETSERFPDNSEVFDPMIYWYENSHFKDSLGSSVLRALSENDAAYHVDKSNVEIFIERLGKNIEMYAQSNSEIVEHVALRIDSINAKSF
jgi:hypothetical protein